ncbi:MAG: asparaginase [Egibacteraceae bacterium]
MPQLEPCGPVALSRQDWPTPPILVRVVRDGVEESAHRGHLVVTDAEGAVMVSLGDPDRLCYARSAAKPFQALAMLDLLDEAGLRLDVEAVAIACASHSGSATHQVEVARLLALADLDESALRCPPGLPAELYALLDQRTPTPLAHNCSGKHAGFLLAHTATGGDPRAYLDPGTRLQRRVRDRLAEAALSQLGGPGVDGCGAPAWTVRLRGLAAGFAKLACGAGPYRRVGAAMTSRPDLVGGTGCADTMLMLADHRIVAKRGAEAVLAAGFNHEWYGPLGFAVKIEDGSTRATGPALAAAVWALGARVGDEIARPTVLGGDCPHGVIEADPAIASVVRATFEE